MHTGTYMGGEAKRAEDAPPVLVQVDHLEKTLGDLVGRLGHLCSVVSGPLPPASGTALVRDQGPPRLRDRLLDLQNRVQTASVFLGKLEQEMGSGPGSD